MIAGLVSQALGGVLLRARMEARKAALLAAAGMLVLTALTLAGAAGLIVVAERYGVVAGLLGGSGLLLLLALAVFLIGRRVPGAAASRRAVEAEAVLEGVPAPGAPGPASAPGPEGVLGGAAPGAPPGLAALAHVHDTVRGHLDGVLPPGGQGALTAMAAQQLARRPVPVLAAAVAAGAVIGVLRRRNAALPAGTEPAAPAPAGEAAVSGATPPPAARPSVPVGVADAAPAAPPDLDDSDVPDGPGRPDRPDGRRWRRTTRRPASGDAAAL